MFHLLQAYITHTLLQEFPVSSSSSGLIVRSAASGHRLGMSSLLAVVSWVSAYEEVVALDLLEGDRAEARSVLGKLDELVDRLMDSHDDMAKEKVSMPTECFEREGTLRMRPFEPNVRLIHV